MPQKRRPQVDGKIRCSMCKQWLPISDYHVKGRGIYADGSIRPHSHCKKCHIKRSTELNNKHWYRADTNFANSKAKELGLYYDLTYEDWQEVVKFYNFSCYLCGTKLTLEPNKETTLMLEHKTPLSRGGTSTKNNVAPSCKRCNRVKSNSTLEEFINLAKVWTRIIL